MSNSTDTETNEPEFPARPDDFESSGRTCRSIEEGVNGVACMGEIPAGRHEAAAYCSKRCQNNTRSVLSKRRSRERAKAEKQAAEEKKAAAAKKRAARKAAATK